MVLKGFKKFKSKKGDSFCVLYVEDDFSPNDKLNSDEVAGLATESMFVDASVASKITAKDIGKKILPQITLSGGKAYVVDVTVVN